MLAPASPALGPGTQPLLICRKAAREVMTGQDQRVLCLNRHGRSHRHLVKDCFLWSFALAHLQTSSDYAPLGLCAQGYVPCQLSVTFSPSFPFVTKLCPPLVPLDGYCSPRLPVRQRLPSTTCNYLRSSAAWRPLPATPQKPPPWVLWRHPSSAAVGPLSCSPSLAGRRWQWLPEDTLVCGTSPWGSWESCIEQCSDDAESR